MPSSLRTLLDPAPGHGHGPRRPGTAGLAFFPELFLPGYRPDGTAGGAAPVSVGAVCVDEYGRAAGTYRRTRLFGAERTAVRPGGRYPVSTLAGVAVAPLICYDVEFPEPARTVADAGAELLVTLSVNMLPYRDEHEVLPRIRAMENRLPHVYVNQVGAESGFRFPGRHRADRRGSLAVRTRGGGGTG